MKRLVDTKFTEEQERFIDLAEGEVWTSNIKCPKCGSDCLDINEKTIVIGTYTQRYGLIDHNAYFDPGDLGGIFCVCHHCGYRWVPRKRCHLGQCEEIKVTTRY